MELKDRVMYIMSKERLSASIFADTIGVQRSSISHILSGRNKPSLEFVQKIVSCFPKYNINWLLMGIGQPLGTENSPTASIKSQSKEESTLFTSVNSSSLQELVSKKPEATAEIPKTEPIKDLVNDEDITHYKTPKSTKKIKQIVLIYTDNTFSTYNPSNED